MTTPEEMKAALIKMLDDFWYKEDVEAAYAIYADDVVFQRVPFPPVVGREANMQADAGTLAAFSDVRSTIDEMIVDGDMAVIRWTWEGAHSGTSPSLGVPATGKQVRFVGCSVYHFRDGKIVEQREYGHVGPAAAARGDPSPRLASAYYRLSVERGKRQPASDARLRA